METLNNIVWVSSNIYSDDIPYNNVDRASPDPDFENSNYTECEKLPIPDEYLWAMFSTGVSFRALSTILKCAFSAADAKDRFNVSTSYLFKNYQRLLQTKEIKYKERIREESTFGTICFDHQATRRIAGKYEGTSHRLAIVWYSNQAHNAIGMPEMPDKTAESQAEAIKNTCEEYGVESRQAVAFGCDNEITNVGIHAGTCVLVERFFNKSLLRLMCRHHILELIIKSVYDLLFGAETQRNVFFVILQRRWSHLREANFPFNAFNETSFTEDMDPGTHQEFEALMNRALNDLRAHALSKKVRDDYREVTLLALNFLGEIRETTKTNQVKFRTLINPSHARFMASIIQGLECYLFRRSIDWTEREEMKHNIMRFSTFSALIYIRYWNRSSNLFDAPSNDLDLLQELQTYKLIDRPVAIAALNAFNRHLNYMGEELSPLSIFSEKTSIQEKNLIAGKLLLTENKITPIRGTKVDNQICNHIAYCSGRTDGDYDWSSISVIDLVGDRSQFFFDTLNLPRSFLRLDASQWKINRDYIRAKQNVQNALMCINDGSERVISNCKNKFNKQRCRKETSFRQNILNLHINLD